MPKKSYLIIIICVSPHNLILTSVEDARLGFSVSIFDKIIVAGSPGGESCKSFISTKSDWLSL